MNFKVKALLCAVLVLVATDGAEAGTLKMRLTDLTNGGTVVLTAEDLNSDGILTFNGSVGTFAFQVATAFSQPAVGDGDVAKMFLSSTSLTSLLGGTLEILLTDTSFDVSAGSNVNWTSQIGGIGSGTVDASQHVDFDNGEFSLAGSNVLSIEHDQVDGAGAFSDTETRLITATGGPFSVTERILVSLDAASFASVDIVSTLTTADVLAPEPATASLAFAAVAFAGLGGWIGRRRGHAPK